ncbi:MAG: Ig-like domain-containing protein [Pseudonocardiaceae bacterium]
MLNSRSVRWRAVGACVAPVAVVATSLLISGASISALLERAPLVSDALAVTTTTTTLTASPASPVGHSSPVTLTAVVSPAAAGTVQFKDGTANIGSPVVVRNGTASGLTSTLAVGSRSLSAVFAPDNPTASTPSTSPMVPFVVTGATDTTTTLTISPTAQIAEGTPVTLTAAVSPATALGTVQFKDGLTDIGGPVSVSNGIASGFTSTLAAGQRSLTAVFTPNNPAAFTASMSSAMPLTVTGSGVGSPQTLTAQLSGLSLDLRTSVLDGQATELGEGPSVLNTSTPVLGGQGLLDVRLSILLGQGLLGGVVQPTQPELLTTQR